MGFEMFCFQDIKLIYSTGKSEWNATFYISQIFHVALLEKHQNAKIGENFAFSVRLDINHYDTTIRI